jgi:hypothetical protein
LTVTGIDCVAAIPIIMQIGQHYPWGDPTEFDIDGATCVITRVEVEDREGEAGANGRYDCVGSDWTITFEFYSGE